MPNLVKWEQRNQSRLFFWRGVGSGTTDSDGILVIENNFRLISFDIVAEPSTHDAYPKMGSKKENFEPEPVRESVKPKFNADVLVGLAGILTETHLRNIRNKKR